MAKAKKAAPPAPPLDLLDQFTKWDPKNAIAILLWKMRHQLPDLTLQVTEQDITSFQACVEYLGIEPTVKIYRPMGRPASPEIPAVPGTAGRPGRSAIPARPADPPRPFVLVQLLDQEGNQFKPIENNEEAAREAERAAQVKRAKEQGVMIANRVLADVGAGVFSNETMKEAAQALLALCQH